MKLTATNLKIKKMKNLYKKVYQAIGEASMCWSKTPTGIFEATRAKQIGDQLIKDFKKEKARLAAQVKQTRWK